MHQRASRDASLFTWVKGKSVTERQDQPSQVLKSIGCKCNNPPAIALQFTFNLHYEVSCNACIIYTAQHRRSLRDAQVRPVNSETKVNCETATLLPLLLLPPPPPPRLLLISHSSPYEATFSRVHCSLCFCCCCCCCCCFCHLGQRRVKQITWPDLKLTNSETVWLPSLSTAITERNEKSIQRERLARDKRTLVNSLPQVVTLPLTSLPHLPFARAPAGLSHYLWISAAVSFSFLSNYARQLLLLSINKYARGCVTVSLFCVESCVYYAQRAASLSGASPNYVPKRPVWLSVSILLSLSLPLAHFFSSLSLSLWSRLVHSSHSYLFVTGRGEEKRKGGVWVRSC